MLSQGQDTVIARLFTGDLLRQDRGAARFFRNTYERARSLDAIRANPVYGQEVVGIQNYDGIVTREVLGEQDRVRRAEQMLLFGKDDA